jgi:hypothetical protein
MGLQNTIVARLAGWIVLSAALAAAPCEAKPPGIQFDVPAVASAVTRQTAVAKGAAQIREVSVDVTLSSLLVDGRGDSFESRPIDELLVLCRLRDPMPVIDYEPRTQLQSDYASPIAVTKKVEESDSFGVNVDGAIHALGAGHFGADDTTKQSDSTQFQKQPPMQAVVASGTTNRGLGVYFKFRWTAQQVLEGEKHFRVFFAVPNSWRGGLMDVRVVASAQDDSLFGSGKNQTIQANDFVIAVHRQDDSQAAELASRLVELDRKLVDLARRTSKQSNGINELWTRLLPGESRRRVSPDWYRRLIREQADPYLDKEIKKLPMPVRVAVLDYTKTREELRTSEAKPSS